MKRNIALFMALLMIFASVPAGAFSDIDFGFSLTAAAIEEPSGDGGLLDPDDMEPEEEQDVPVINVGDYLNLVLENEVTYYLKFIPEKSGGYKFKSSSNAEYVTIAFCDTDKNVLIEAEAEWYGEYAVVGAYLTEGNTYYCAITVKDNFTDDFSTSASLEYIAPVSGTCGENLLWTLEPATGVFTVEGEGEMDNYDYYEVDWYEKRSKIKSVVIGEGVTSVGDYAFYECYNLESVQLPSTLKAIGSYSFYYCYSLESVNLPEGLEHIKSSAFEECYSLKEITFPSTVSKIGAYAFNGCDSLESVELPDSLSTINSYAFSWCDALKNVIIPDSVTVIEEGAFSSCYKLENLTLGNGVQRIEDSVFEGCSKLGEVVLPASLTSISPSAFRYSKVEKFIVEAESTTYAADEAGVLFNKDKTRLIQYPTGSSLTEYTIPEAVTNLGSACFYNSDNLEKIVLNNKIQSVPYQAFYDCDKLVTVEFTDAIKRIEEEAFYSCDSLISIVIPVNTVYIGEDAFYDCEKLSDITFPDNVTEIDDRAFGRTAWYSAQPDGVIYTGKVAYAYKGTMPKRTEIIIPEGTLRITANLFNNQDRLIAITLPSTLQKIDEDAFYSCDGLKSITLPDNVHVYGSNTFVECDGLESVTIGNAVTFSASSAFKGCDNLESVIIGEGCYFYGDAFYNCSSLKSVIIGDNTKFSGSAFYNCDSLVDVTLGDNLTFGTAFYDCDKIEKISVGKNTSISESFLHSCQKLKEVYVGDGTSFNYWYNNSFEECVNLEKLTIGNNCKSAYQFELAGCISLKEIIIGDNCDFEWHSFRNLKALEAVTIGSGCTFDHETFYNCPELKTVTIGNNTSFSHDNFDNCTELKELVIGDNVTFSHSCFENSDKLETVTVGLGCSLENIFAYCENVKTVIFPNGVSSIPYGTFRNCTKLAEVHFSGTQQEWEALEVGENNEPLKNAAIYFAYTPHVHAYSESVTLAPTCIAQGEKTFACACGVSYTEVIDVDADAHSKKYTEAVKATFEEDGKTSGVYCELCRETLVEAETIPYVAEIILSETKYICDGKQKNPKVTVKDSQGRVLTKNVDYVLTSSSGRKAVGNYLVQVTLKGDYSGAKRTSFTIIPAKPTDIVAKRSGNVIKLSWAAVLDAPYYRIYEYDPIMSSYTELGTVKKTDASIKLEENENKYYVISAGKKLQDGSVIWSEYNTRDLISTSYIKSAPTVKTSTTTGKFTVSWSSVSGVSGYELWYSTSENGTYKKLGQTTKTSYSRTVKSGSVYYFKVRTVKTVGGVTYYGMTSNAAKVTVK